MDEPQISVVRHPRAADASPEQLKLILGVVKLVRPVDTKCKCEPADGKSDG